MEPIALITPTRDRPKMLEFCKQQVWHFKESFYHIIVNDPPITKGFDIAERIFKGIGKAKALGCDFVFVGEDDDFYPKDYLSRFGDISNVDFVGCEHTIYYNLTNKTWKRFDHPNRSSLFTTGFRISALKGFKFPDSPFVDIKLWEFANENKKRIKFIKETGAVGIKGHLEGKTGGAGHKMTLKNKDPDCTWLQQNVSKEAYEFYMSL